MERGCGSYSCLSLSDQFDGKSASAASGSVGWVSAVMLTPSSTAPEAPTYLPLPTADWPLQTTEPSTPASRSPTLTNVPVEQDPKPQITSSSTVHQPTPAYEARHGRRERRCGRSLGAVARTWGRLWTFIRVSGLQI